MRAYLTIDRSGQVETLKASITVYFFFQTTCQEVTRQRVCSFRNKILDKAKGTFPRTSDTIAHLWDTVEQASWACDQAVKMDGVGILVSSCALQNQIPLGFLFLVLRIELRTSCMLSKCAYCMLSSTSCPNRILLKEKTRAVARMLPYPKFNIKR